MSNTYSTKLKATIWKIPRIILDGGMFQDFDGDVFMNLTSSAVEDSLQPEFLDGLRKLLINGLVPYSYYVVDVPINIINEKELSQFSVGVDVENCYLRQNVIAFCKADEYIDERMLGKGVAITSFSDIDIFGLSMSSAKDSYTMPFTILQSKIKDESNDNYIEVTFDGTVVYKIFKTVQFISDGSLGQWYFDYWSQSYWVVPSGKYVWAWDSYLSAGTTTDEYANFVEEIKKDLRKIEQESTNSVGQDNKDILKLSRTINKCSFSAKLLSADLDNLKGLLAGDYIYGVTIYKDGTTTANKKIIKECVYVGIINNFSIDEESPKISFSASSFILPKVSNIVAGVAYSPTHRRLGQQDYYLGDTTVMTTDNTATCTIGNNCAIVTLPTHANGAIAGSYLPDPAEPWATDYIFCEFEILDLELNGNELYCYQRNKTDTSTMIFKIKQNGRYAYRRKAGLTGTGPAIPTLSSGAYGEFAFFFYREAGAGSGNITFKVTYVNAGGIDEV